VNEIVDGLVRDLLEWISKEDRPYLEAMDAWRTSCPRLQVWEEANDRGFISREFDRDHGALVRLTPAGQAQLRH